MEVAAPPEAMGAQVDREGAGVVWGRLALRCGCWPMLASGGKEEQRAHRVAVAGLFAVV